MSMRPPRRGSGTLTVPTAATGGHHDVGRRALPLSPPMDATTPIHDPTRRRPQLVAPRGARAPEFAGEPAPAPAERHHRRRRDPGRRLHGHVDGLPSEAARPRRRRRAAGAGHLRRRAQRSQRRIRQQLLERASRTSCTVFGDDAALRVCARRARRACDAIGAFCDENGIDAWFRKDGDLTVAALRAQVGAWADLVMTADRLGVADDFQVLTRRGGARARATPRPSTAACSAARRHRAARAPRARPAPRR